MAKTFGNIVEEILSNVRGFTAASDQVTSLKSSMGTTDITGQVDDLSIVSAGIIEIDDELMWVKGVDSSSGTFSLLPKGRGWEGTVAATHDIGDTVTVSPAYPRSRVKQAVNDAIQALWPLLYSVATVEFTMDDLSKVAWGIPAEAEQILDVRYRDAIGNWRRIRCWEVERSADTTDFPTGASLRITEAVPFGYTIQVVYGKRPTALASESDPFTSTGYDDQISDLVILSAMARLLPMLDVHRLQVTHVAADEMDQPRPIGSAKALADSFRQQYTARLADERAVLNRRYPARIHITR